VVSSLVDDFGLIRSTKLDAEKRLALQEEKQALEAKLLEVYVDSIKVKATTYIRTNRPKLKARLSELKAAAAVEAKISSVP
jgi:ATP-binding cassette subfamily D (ALD) long-chain fatty acid import protein